MLTVENLSVAVGEKEIIKGIDLQIKSSEVVVLFGPNGSGKTTLLKTIMGFPGYNITSGRIIFNHQLLNGLSIEERVRLGIGIMHQHPPKIRGVKLKQFADYLCKDKEKIERLSQELSLQEHLNRDVNLDFSGGEIKRSELFQVILQDPMLLLMDEPESGVDLENIAVMGRVLNEFLKKKDKSAFIITHTGYILDYVKATRGCVLLDGKFWCVGDPKEMFKVIRTSGYDKCKECVCPHHQD
ncbi:MAG: ABC transporter ATP-binding protein [Candidatus Omnitrophica bacterium]|nr:ABC transporter ATP-binding protein [Candidatus Omnitrophota bacterium]